jgi:acyl carrier protein
VVHAAGVPGRGLLQAKSRDEAAAVLAPKVAGTLALDAALEGESLDFFALYSSATAVVGGVGEVDYCAANAFLDAYAETRRAEGRPMVSVNWAPWQWDTWQSAAFAAQPEVRQAIASLRERHGITMEEGFDALLRAIGSGLPQVLVLPHGLEATVELWTTSTVLRMVTGDRPAPGTAYPRPHLSTPYVPPRSPVERRLAEIWMRQLGLEKVGVHDQFFELGGTSLVGLGLVAELERAFEVTIAPASLYGAPTIASQAELLAPSEEAPQLVAADSARGALRRQLRRRRAGHPDGVAG